MEVIVLTIDIMNHYEIYISMYIHYSFSYK